VRTGAKWSRLDVKLVDKCQLWDKSASAEVEVGQMVTISNVVKKTWNEFISFHSTDLTAVEVSLCVYGFINVLDFRRMLVCYILHYVIAVLSVFSMSCQCIILRHMNFLAMF